MIGKNACMNMATACWLCSQPGHLRKATLTSLGLRFSAVNILVVKTINAFGTVQGMPLLLEPPSFFPLCLQFPGPPWGALSLRGRR